MLQNQVMSVYPSKQDTLRLIPFSAVVLSTHCSRNHLYVQLLAAVASRIMCQTRPRDTTRLDCLLSAHSVKDTIDAMQRSAAMSGRTLNFPLTKKEMSHPDRIAANPSRCF